MIQAKIIKDSISPNGVRLTTMEIEMHRYCLAELNKHRLLSNSASSSRAIPVRRVINRLKDEPAIPVEWGEEERGMQARRLLSPQKAAEAEQVWLNAMNSALEYAEQMIELGVHKQIVNRILEPFSWQAVVLTATYWKNLFNLRAHPDAQPEFRELAYVMKQAYDNSVPEPIGYNEWHLPFVTEEEKQWYPLEDVKKFSVARCARTSYWNQGKINPESDLSLFETLIRSNPIHSVPMEMVATPALPGESCRGNYNSWHQWRHLLEDAQSYISLQ